MLSARIALHFICKKNSKIPSFTSLVSILGVAFGVCAFLIVITVLNSFQSEMRHIISTINPHVVLYSPSGVASYDNLLATVQNTVGNDIQSASPFLYSETIASAGRNSASLYIRAIPGEQSASAQDYSRLITPQNAIAHLNQSTTTHSIPPIIIGKEVANQLNVGVGDTINLMLFRNASQGDLEGSLPGLSSTRTARVVGILSVGISEYDAHYALMNLTDGQALFAIPKFISGMEIKLKNPDTAQSIAPLLEEQTHYNALAWENIDKGLFLQISRDSTAIKLIVLLISFVSGFNIVVTLSLTVMDRTAQISLLRGLGAQKKHILRIFVLCGAILGSVGALLGVLCGVGLLKIFSGIHLGDFKQFYYLDAIPVEYDPVIIALCALSALTLSICGALYPAYKATTISPLLGLKAGN